MLELYLSLAENESDAQKIELIYNEYKSFMMGICMKVLKNQALSSEAVHDSVIKLIKNIDRIDEVISDRTKSFIYIITLNTAKTKLMKEKKEWAYDSEFIDSIAISENDAFDKVYLNELFEIFLKLPDIYRDPLELSVYYGLTSKEIAKLLDISDSLVRKRILKAKEQMRNIFEREGITE